MQAPPLTKSLVRAMNILKQVSAAKDGASPAAIADELGLPRPTIYRLLATLEAVGMVERNVDGAWFTGHELLRLGRSADQSRALLATAQPTMQELVSRTGETAMLAVPLGGFDAEVISQVDAPNLLAMAQWVGRPIPPHASAACKILLADLEPEVRSRYTAALPLTAFTAHTITDHQRFERELDHVARRGYAETIDELEDGLSGIAAPIRRPDRTCIGFIGIYGPTARVCGPTHEQMTAAVLEAASKLAAEL
jgi:IclR family transcriptional regulator, acetate operon repressor